MPAPLPYGDETLVNTTTTNAQKAPQVTALANGTYVVVWQDSSTTAPDSSPDSVRAQIFHADGTRLGSDFVLSEFPFAVQQDPVVTALPDGRFVAAWESFNHDLQDQSGSHISARIFNPDGTPSTGEFQVNTHTDFWQTKPAIATLDTGGFVITWMHDFVGGNVNYDIFARVYGADGQPVSAEDRGVDISTGVIERAPVVTGLPGGKFVIAWEDAGSATQTDGSGSHIRAMIYTGGNFQPLDGASFTANSTVANDQSDPAIATLSDGNFVLSWTSAFSASDDDVRGRVFNGHGTAQSLDFGIDTSGSNVQETQSAIAALPNGEYFVVWRDSGGAAAGQSDGSGSHIRGAVMSGNGTQVSGQFIINTTTNGSQGEPAVTCLADGRVVVVWTDFGMNGGDTSGAAVRSQILDPRTAAVTLSDSGGNDEWVGTAFADTMSGGAGVDLLEGAGGEDSLSGGAAADTMVGGDGNDKYYVDDANDVVIEEAGGGTADRVVAYVDYTLAANVENVATNAVAGTTAIDLTGNSLGNDIRGNAGANILNGKGGADTMRGYGGNDKYYVDDANDVVIEEAGGGTADQVVTYVDYTLAANVEILTTNFAAGTAAIDLTGNSLANDIRGNAGINVLNGKSGADTMRGYGDNDKYYVDDANDVVIEEAGGGTADLVVSYVDYILAANVENASTNAVAGTAAIDLTGNSLANDLSGNAGVNILNGKEGVDTMRGYGGNDKYYVDDANDVVIEEAGGGTSDQVVTYVDYVLAANVEILTTNFTAGTVAIDLTGNSLANDIRGNAGSNVVDGKGGSDTLRGYGGNDTFVFDTALGAANIDTVIDFSVADDTIRLDNAIFTAIAGTGVLTLAQFAANAGGTAQDASDRIIYETDTGKLFYDSNGSAAGGVTQFATLSSGLALTNADFTIV